jgi:hypothetical protein
MSYLDKVRCKEFSVIQYEYKTNFIEYEHVRIYYIINAINLLHVSAIFREVLYKGYIINASKTNAQIYIYI